MSNFLTPDKTDKINGLTIKRKIIPLNAKRKNGNYFRDQRKLSPKYVTIHNTGAINQAKGTTMAEQYSRATYPNDNMGTVRPHYYVDEVEAWQLIEHDRVAWHAGEQGNTQSIGIEIIGAKAEDNGARLAAIILIEEGLTTAALRTHNYWMGLPNKIVSGAPKNCPYYILPHWDKFVAKVANYVKEFSGKPEPKPEPTPATDVLYRVQVGAFKNKAYADKMLADLSNLAYFKANGIVPFLVTAEDRATTTARTVKVTTKQGLNIRDKPNGKKIGALNFGAVVEISEEQSGWGKLADQDGWISTDYVESAR